MACSCFDNNTTDIWLDDGTGYVMNGKEHLNFALYSECLLIAGFGVGARGYRFTLEDLGWFSIGVYIGMKLPDCDHPKTPLGAISPIPWLHKKMKMFKWYKGFWKHGGITHTILVNTWIFILAYINRSMLGAGIGFGYASHLYLDHITGNKLSMLYWPIKTKKRR